MEKSRIPVKPQTKPADKPGAAEPRPRNPGLLARGKKPNAPSSSNAADARVSKAGHFGSQEEVKRRNQLLTEENTRLKGQLASSQELIKNLTESSEKLQDEVADLKTRLEKYETLEFENIDPVSGARLPSSTEEMSKQREETKLFTGQLVLEIQDFSQAAAEQSSLTQGLMAKLIEEQRRRQQFVAEQRALQREMEQCKASLQETHRWLGSQ